MANIDLNCNLEPDAPCECDNCGETWKSSDLETIVDVQDRLDPGGTVPAGQCPGCGALAYLVKESGE